MNGWDGMVIIGHRSSKTSKTSVVINVSKLRKHVYIVKFRNEIRKKVINVVTSLQISYLESNWWGKKDPPCWLGLGLRSCH